MSLFSDYQAHDAVGLAALVRRREVSPVELLESALARLEAVNPLINAVVDRFTEDAFAQARSLTGEEPLAGVPFLLKDLNIQVLGRRTSNGSRLWRDHRAVKDSTVTARYRAAGLLLFGFTNTAELGLACETAPALFGPTRNPWNRERSVGGSSGGAAAAVAAGIVPAAHATDGGGSIRIPSSNTGTFGLKPTRGRNPFGPDLGEGWNGLSVHHAITRSVRDSAALLDATHGPEPGDPYAAPRFDGRYLDLVERDPAPLRIAFQTVDHEGRAVDPAAAKAVTDAAALLESLGHRVVEASPGVDGAALKRATRIIVASNIANVLRAREEVLGRPIEPDELEPITRLWAGESARYSSADLARSIWTIHGLSRLFGRFFQSHDVLLTPTFAAPPLPIGTVDMQSTDLDGYYETLRRYSAFTSVYNSAGIPAASVPFALADGLPVGVQIAAPLGEDGRVLQLAAQIERARPWAGLYPSLPE